MRSIMGFFDWLKPQPPPDAATQALIERAVATVDPLIRQVRGYEKKLAPAVRRSIEYCDDIAARIPGPFEISRAAFAADPMVHALFGSADDIGQMLAKSQCVRERFAELAHSTGQCCALLGMRHREKSGFGVELTGDIVRMDVPQKTLYFSDHTLAEPAPDPAAARQHLREVLYDGLLKGFAAHVAEVRAERDGLHRDEAIANACVRSGNDPEAHTRRLGALREQLRATADTLQPAQLLDTLAQSLATPEPYLRLDPVSISVDRTGVITGRGEDGAETLRFAELTSRDQRRWVVMLARIEHDEVQRALERFQSARRYIVI
jgi:ribosomal protein S14